MTVNDKPELQTIEAPQEARPQPAPGVVDPTAALASLDLREGRTMVVLANAHELANNLYSLNPMALVGVQAVGTKTKQFQIWITRGIIDMVQPVPYTHAEYWTMRDEAEADAKRQQLAQAAQRGQLGPRLVT